MRRSKVIELKSSGISQIEIARQLQVSRTSITEDVQYLRNEAKELIKEYVTEHLPEQYQICLTELDTIIRKAFEIFDSTSTEDIERNCRQWNYSKIPI